MVRRILPQRGQEGAVDLAFLTSVLREASIPAVLVDRGNAILVANDRARSALDCVRNRESGTPCSVVGLQSNPKFQLIAEAPVEADHLGYRLLFFNFSESGPGRRLLSLRGRFGLTVAESRLACLVVLGLSLRDASSILRVSDNTVRTQLKAVFRKTGVARQGELIALALGTRASNGPKAARNPKF